MTAVVGFGRAVRIYFDSLYSAGHHSDRYLPYVTDSSVIR
jgi:hypothetical protein